ncbi:MAG: glycosyltransferase [Acidobacteria bacterium]|nr:glycosyltransferase [Acidobacteriota bacterium]
MTSSSKTATVPRRPADWRIALVAGGLSQGGAEKQLLYMGRALVAAGAVVRCYSLTRGDHYEAAFRAAGLDPIWIGQRSAPPARLWTLARSLRAFRPDVVQAGHFFVNLYAGIAAKLCRAVSIGAIRNDGAFELRENPGWGPWLLRTPTVLVANSAAGAAFARASGRGHDEVVIVPNVIDLAAQDAATTTLQLRDAGVGPVVALVGRLVWAKRVDRFLAALARVRAVVPEVRGVIVGDGPERPALEEQAVSLGLAEAVRFVGRRSDVPAILRQVDVLVSTSSHEGFPNVLLEGMAAGLPVVTTPAGDAAAVVVAGETGIVVGPDDIDALVDAIRRLVRDPGLRRQFGEAGRRRVEAEYQDRGLADRLFRVYEHARGLDHGGRALESSADAARRIA